LDPLASKCCSYALSGAEYKWNYNDGHFIKVKTTHQLALPRFHEDAMQ